MIRSIELGAGDSRLDVLPGIGGGIVALEMAGRPILRKRPPARTPHPFDLAAITLAPFSNRIGGGAFTWNGARYRVAPNLPGEDFPLHGDAYQRAWEIVVQTGAEVRLALNDGRIGPYCYVAEQCYRLEDGCLIWSLRVENRSEATLPYGCGFHPWFPRTPQTSLRFMADGLWLNDEQHLARRLAAIDACPHWDFREGAALPQGLINNGFAGWRGGVEIEQGAGGVSVRVNASSNLSTAIVFSPGDGADFFCFEPVSHPINAHHLPGAPGLVALARGEALSAWVTLQWDGGVSRYRRPTGRRRRLASDQS